DPPYGLGLQTSQHLPKAHRFEEIEGAYEINGAWLPDAYRATRQGGALYMFAKWSNVGEWMDLVRGAGFNIRSLLVWDKLMHTNGDLRGAYAPQHEFIIFATKGRHLLRGRRMPDIIRYPRLRPGKHTHPYEKPVGLLEIFIRKSSDA